MIKPNHQKTLGKKHKNQHATNTPAATVNLHGVPLPPRDAFHSNWSPICQRLMKERCQWVMKSDCGEHLTIPDIWNTWVVKFDHKYSTLWLGKSEPTNMLEKFFGSICFFNATQKYPPRKSILPVLVQFTWDFQERFEQSTYHPLKNAGWKTFFPFEIVPF